MRWRLKSSQRGLSLIETVVAMVVMTLVAGAITQSMISIERTQYLADRRCSLVSECARQSEIARGMPLAQVFTELPNSGEKLQRIATTDGKLTGIIANDTERASVWWTRTESILPITGEKVETIQVDLFYSLWGNQVQLGTTNQVLRLMERETRLSAE
ncbi:MAG: prepilin-type N-terminal cleavage/methylation domain-containing protein [Verrucomicrobiota bacterium]